MQAIYKIFIFWLYGSKQGLVHQLESLLHAILHLGVECYSTLTYY